MIRQFIENHSITIVIITTVKLFTRVFNTRTLYYCQLDAPHKKGIVGVIADHYFHQLVQYIPGEFTWRIPR